jgi:hypothetical protein
MLSMDVKGRNGREKDKRKKAKVNAKNGAGQDFGGARCELSGVSGIPGVP